MQQISCVFLVSLALSVPAVSQNSNAAIIAALQGRQFDQALELIHAALRESPRDARLLTLEGLALSQTGKRPEALRAYNQALAVSPSNLAALEGAAELEFSGRSKRAIPLLNRILALQPDNTTAHVMLAVMAYRQHDCQLAVKHFEQVRAAISGQEMALGAYGSCLIRLQRAEEAVPVFRQIAALSPGDPHALYNLAAAQMEAKQGSNALETLQPLLQANTDADTLALASAAYESHGDTPKAVELLRQAIITSPENPRYYVDFATLSFNHDSFQVGVDMLNAGLKRLPQAAELYVARGILYIQLGEYDKGEADFNAAHKLDPSQASASLAEGLAQMQQSKLNKALKTVDSQLDAHPNDAFLHYLKSEVLSRNGAQPGTAQFDAAIKAAARAVQLKPDFTLAQNVLGGLYLKSGQFEKAIAQSRTTLRYDAGDEVALYHLVQALRRIKDPRREIPELTKRLNAAREQSKQKEAAENKYRLYEKPAEAEQQAPQ